MQWELKMELAKFNFGGVDKVGNAVCSSTSKLQALASSVIQLIF
jgi:hypothetical protein